MIVTDETLGTSLVINKQKMVMEAGEIRVAPGDSLIPTKLRLLGTAGWTVVDAWKLDGGGFNLLLTRSVDSEDNTQDEQAELVVRGHHGTPRCPNYCSCLTGVGL